MASMNYCFTICRAADEKVQQETHSSTSISGDTSAPSSPGNGAYFFGRFFSFGSTSSSSPSTSNITNPFTIRAHSDSDTDENLF